MNLQRADFSETNLLTEERALLPFDPVQRAVAELERSRRDLRTVSLDEFKALMTGIVADRAARREHLVSC